MQFIVGIAEYRTATRPEDVITTYSLGSCVGLSLYDPSTGVGGLGHFMLPLSKANPEKARVNPVMFTDTGVTELLDALFQLGARRSSLVARVAGGASMHDDQGLFEIGKRNHTVLRKLLWKNNILIQAEEVGGTIPRTMTLYMNSGQTTIRNAGKEHVL